MKTKKLLDIVGILVLFIGFFLAFLPHAIHASVGLDEDTSHLRHVITGLILIVAALGILIYNNKALKWQKHL